MTCHLVFDLKIYMTIKARYVTGVHLTDVLTHIKYPSFVSRDIVRIGLLMATLDGFDILAGDVHTAFLESPRK